MSYQLISEERGIYFKLAGNVSFKEIRRASAEGWEHVNNASNIYQIWNYLEVMQFDAEQMQAIIGAKLDSIAFNNVGLFTKIAFLTTRQDIIEHFSIYKKHIKQELIGAEIYSSEDEARHWISQQFTEKYYSGL